ncbi:MAG: histidinol-phosphate transaminase [Coprococcus sp.]|nr:histidinol-phosphate transaminase [Coprococcus sp.]
MSAWIDNIRKVEPYVPGEQPKDTNVIKLNTNENPYGPSPRAKEVMQNQELLRLYPDPTASDLVNALAEYHGVKPSQVFVGVGSDDVLAMSFLTFFNSDKPIVFPDITYSFYDVWAELFKIPYKRLPVDESFRLVKEDYYKQNGGVVFPNPNAPTGIYEKLSNVEDIVSNNRDVIVIVDEAYIDFGGTSALELIDKYDNLVVVRTFSKSRSMAGLRIGYAISNPVLIKALNDVKYSYNSYTMNRPSIIMGAESVKDEEYFRSTIQKVVNTRERFVRAIKPLGFTCLPSSANFVFATHESIPAKEIFSAAKAANIYVRYFDKPRIDNYLRISIGTDEEMDAFISFLSDFVASY